MEVALSGLWAPGFSVYTRAFRRVSMVLGECVVYKENSSSEWDIQGIPRESIAQLFAPMLPHT